MADGSRINTKGKPDGLPPEIVTRVNQLVGLLADEEGKFDTTVERVAASGSLTTNFRALAPENADTDSIFSARRLFQNVVPYDIDTFGDILKRAMDLAMSCAATEQEVQASYPVGDGEYAVSVQDFALQTLEDTRGKCADLADHALDMQARLQDALAAWMDETANWIIDQQTGRMVDPTAKARSRSLEVKEDAPADDRKNWEVLQQHLAETQARFDELNSNAWELLSLNIRTLTPDELNNLDMVYAFQAKSIKDAAATWVEVAQAGKAKVLSDFPADVQAAAVPIYDELINQFEDLGVHADMLTVRIATMEAHIDRQVESGRFVNVKYQEDDGTFTEQWEDGTGDPSASGGSSRLDPPADPYDKSAPGPSLRKDDSSSIPAPYTDEWAAADAHDDLAGDVSDYHDAVAAHREMIDGGDYDPQAVADASVALRRQGDDLASAASDHYQTSLAGGYDDIADGALDLVSHVADANTIWATGLY